MLKNIFMTLAGSAFVFAGLTACDDMLGNNEHEQWLAERHAAALVEGQEALAACIETRCKTLNIDGMALEDYTVINDLSHVTVLMASRTTLDDLADISGMAQLKELHITNTEISDLGGLAAFPQLQVLHFQNLPNGVAIAPIGSLTNLTELALGSVSGQADLSFVQNLRRLEKLKLSWSGTVADFAFLRGHPALKVLDIDGGLPTDQSALLTLPRLESIFVMLGMGFGGAPLDAEVRQELERRGTFSYNEAIVVC